MLNTPKITNITARPTAVIHLIVPREGIQNVMGPTVGELFSAIAAQGVPPAGPWFTHHLRRPADTFDMEVSVPVSTPIVPAGRVQPSEWPSMKVAQAVYQGPYEGLGAAWGEFIDWIESNGHQPADDLWECYLVGPESSTDPATWRTELNRQVLD
jgi:effector-binding domain-containing protein